MLKMFKAVKYDDILKQDQIVTNFMNGDSYVINPLDTLKMISASSIFGEPSYYVDCKHTPYSINECIGEYSIIPKEYISKTTVDIFTDAIDKALDYDFKGTLEWAVTLRHNFYMRVNPQIIIMRAALHPKRKEFTSNNPGAFNEYNQKIMSRADDCMSQMSYYLYLNRGKKNNIPTIMKKSWANKLSTLTPYEVNKYQNHEIGMINAVRLCHANSPIIDELMRTGTVNVKTNERTWEQYRSEGKDWEWILQNCKLGHMALIRNLRNIFTEIENIDLCKAILQDLKKGVVNSKQFPFRYWSALKAINASECNHQPLIIDALEKCMDLSLANMPKLKGKTMCLSDNSGSAWGAISSEYGTVKIAEIDNLSSVITAACSDEGYVGKFGDRLLIYPISKRRGILSQTDVITKNKSDNVGGSTEGGIWEFFKNAIDNKQHWDNIFIYSDMQAGHGNLYGTVEQMREYNKRGYGTSTYHINVFKLILDYRKMVNPKVNVFCIQTAGYNNVLIPEYAYRTNIMYGWTGKESLFAKTIIDEWDEIEKTNNNLR